MSTPANNGVTRRDVLKTTGQVAVAAAFILLAFYLLVPFVEVIAPYNQTTRHGDFLYAPPQPVHLMHEGRFVGPFVYPYRFTFDLEKAK